MDENADGVAGGDAADDLQAAVHGCAAETLEHVCGRDAGEGGPELTTGEESAPAEPTSAELAASASSPREGMPGTSGTEGSAVSGRRVPADSRQTSLSHWLL